MEQSYAALNILLSHTHVDEQFINLPFHGEAYEGYFALDIICIEATFHFEDYEQVLMIENKNLAVNIFSVIQKLIFNRASSKILNDENEDLNKYLKMRANKKYCNESIWSLIARIAEFHELRTMPLLNKLSNHKTLHPDNNSTANLVAQRWQSNGMVPETITEIKSVNTATEAEILDQLVALSDLPPKLK